MYIKIRQQFFSSILLFLFIGRLFGLTSLTYKKVRNEVVLGRSKIWIFHCFFVLPALVAFVIYGNSEAMKHPVVVETRLGSDIAVYIEHIEFGIIFITFASRLILAPMNIRNFLKYLKHLDDVDQCLDINKNFQDNSRSFGVIVLVIFSTVEWTTHFINSFCYEDLTDGSFTFLDHFKNYIGLYLMHYSTTLSLLFYVSIVRLIEVRIEKLSIYIDLLRIKLIKKKDKINSEKSLDVEKLKESDSVIKDIKIAINAHRRLCSAIYRCNNEYGISLLFVMIICIYYLAATPYHLLLKLVTNSSVTIILSESLWIILHVLKVLLVTGECGRCEEKLQKAAFVVRQCISFDIPETVRGKISGVVTTYVVILFQSGRNA